MNAQIITIQYLCWKEDIICDKVALIDILMASTLLGSKTQECSRRIRDIVNAFHMIYQQTRHKDFPYQELKYVSDEYYSWRDRATRAEMLILRALGFHIQPVVLPTSLLANYLKALDLSEHKPISQLAMNYINDAVSGESFSRFSLPTVVCSAIRLACLDKEHGLPERWYEVFDVTKEKLDSCSTCIRNVYSVSLDLTLPLTEEETFFLFEKPGSSAIAVAASKKRRLWDDGPFSAATSNKEPPT